MKKIFAATLFLLFTFTMQANCSMVNIPKIENKESLSAEKTISLSGELLYKVKTETPTDSLELSLAKIKLPELISALNNDDARKTFWVNIYNAWFQILSVREKKTKPEIFSKKLITIAETKFSLDDIEHGILRKHQWKLGGGYIPQACPGKIISQLEISKIDYRIHFALNCGAKSCPPIAFYKYEKIEEQLEIAASSFLTTETEINETNRVVSVSKIMQWFKGDFGGNDGIKNILSKYLSKDFSSCTIRYKKYDWKEELKNFAVDK